MILKNFFFEAVNNFFALFYLAFFKFGTLYGTEVRACKDDCLSGIETQLAVLFMGKIFMGKIVELALPLVAGQVAEVLVLLSALGLSCGRKPDEDDTDDAELEPEAPAGDRGMC